MRDQQTHQLDVYPHEIAFQYRTEFYVTLCAAAGLLLLSPITASPAVLAGGVALGLFILGELYAATGRVRHAASVLSVALTIDPGEHEHHSLLRVDADGGVNALPAAAHVGFPGGTATESGPERRSTDDSWQYQAVHSGADISTELTIRAMSPWSLLGVETTLVESTVTLPDQSEATGSTLATTLGVTAGQATTRQHGSEVDGIREYTSGDPIGDIDWKATAKHGRLHIRSRIGESAAPHMLLVDLSSIPVAVVPAVEWASSALLGGVDMHRPVGCGTVAVTGEPRVVSPERGRVARQQIAQAVESVTEAAPEASTDRQQPSYPGHAPARRVLGPTTRVGETIDAFAAGQSRTDRNPLLQLLAQVRASVGTGVTVSLLCGTQLPQRTVDAVQAAANTFGAVDTYVVQSEADSEQLVGALADTDRASVTRVVAERSPAVVADPGNDRVAAGHHRGDNSPSAVVGDSGK